MLFPLPQAPAMPWTGEVRAFAYYVTPECLSVENVATVYVARKRYADGSTVTVVRSVAHDRIPTLRVAFAGEGRIERNPQGAATKVELRVDSRLDGTALARGDFAYDKKRQALVGDGMGGGGHASGVGLATTNLLLDPLEALAFGASPSGWNFPTGTYGWLAKGANTVGMRVESGFPRDFPYEIAGRREMYRRVDLVRSWVGSSIAVQPEAAGSLLYRQDGSLAAYAPLYAVERLPGDVFWSGGYGKSGLRPTEPPPFELKGKLAKMWDQGLNVGIKGSFSLGAILGIFVPTRVSPQARSAVLASIPDPEAPPKEAG